MGDKAPEQRSGDRRKANDPAYQGEERRMGDRRKPPEPVRVDPAPDR